MKHMTLMLLSVGMLLLAVVAFLYLQTRSALQQQELLYHQILAEDAFDHVETQLALLLREEEERSVAEFHQLCQRAHTDQDGAFTYFQIDRQDTVLLADIERQQRLQEHIAASLNMPSANTAGDTPLQPLYILQNKQQPLAQEQTNQGAYQQRVQQNSLARSFNVQQSQTPQLRQRPDSFVGKAPAFRLAAASSGTLLLLRELPQNSQLRKQGIAVDMQRLQQQVINQYQADAADQHPIELSCLYGDRQQNIQAVSIDADSIGFYHQLGAPFDGFGLLARMELIQERPGISLTTLNAVTLIMSMLLIGGLCLIARSVQLSQQFAQRRQNFASAVSHELKTPLTAIRMHAEMLESGMVADDAKRQSYYQTIHAESQRLSRLIDNVLTLSQLERQQYRPHVISGDLRVIVDEAVAMLRPHAQLQGFAIACHFPDELPSVHCDRDALIQVIINAVDNAIKFARDADDKRIVLSLNQEQGQGQLCLSIRDFGPGVAEAQLQQIFEAFYRGEEELTRSSKGTGIGLALVRQLAEAMGARVTAVNADGGGLQLSICFPLGQG